MQAQKCACACAVRCEYIIARTVVARFGWTSSSVLMCALAAGCSDLKYSNYPLWAKDKRQRQCATGERSRCVAAAFVVDVLSSHRGRHCSHTYESMYILYEPAPSSCYVRRVSYGQPFDRIRSCVTPQQLRLRHCRCDRIRLRRRSFAKPLRRCVVVSR